MREKILEIIKKENRKLQPIIIMSKIKEDYTAEDLHELIEELRLMCNEGILRCKNEDYFFNDLLCGVIDIHEKGNGHLLVKDGDDIFIPKNQINGAHDKDTILADYTNKNKNEARVIRIVKRNLGKAIAEVKNINGKLTLVPKEEMPPYYIKFDTTDIKLVDGLLVHYDYVKDLEKNKVLVKVDRVLGHKNALSQEGQEPTEMTQNITDIACEFGLKLEFSEEALAEAKNMPSELSEEMIKDGLENGREDFRNDVVFTIDGKDTKDIDDAISIKLLPNGNYELGVHIADVSHYVRPGMALWKEAEIRGNSNYLGNKVIPMLPVELSNGICSLNPNEDRFTVSTIMEIDHSGKIVNRRVTKGIIRSKKKMNYDAVQDIIDGKETPDTEGYDYLKYTIKENDTVDTIAYENGITPLELKNINKGINFVSGVEINIPTRKIINNMNALSNVLSSMKERRGEINFESDEAKIIQDEVTDEVLDVKAREQRPSEKLIENFMVAANETVAEFLEEYDMATYRIHEHPLQKKIEEFVELINNLGLHYPGKINAENITPIDCQKLLSWLSKDKKYKVFNKKMLRSMQKARYAITNLGHFGIASKCYTHFTSPIRRMDDLLNHTSITRILENDVLDTKYVKSWVAYLATICDSISECERNSEKAEYACDDMLKASYMEKHIGEEFEATIDSTMQGFFFVQTNNLIDGRVDSIIHSDGKVDYISSYYDYNDKFMGYTKNGKAVLTYGDKVIVKCVAADATARQVDFALVRKAS